MTRRHDPATFIRYRQGLEDADRHASPSREALLGKGSVTVGPAPTLPDLDDAQQWAATVALGASTLAVIHGPPGTGKTWVLRAMVDRGERPWALADSNTAVDHLARQAEGAGVDVVRVRSNDEGEIGFVADPRRLTVPLTRARRWMWQAGGFAELIAHHEATGTLQSFWESPWSEALG